MSRSIQWIVSATLWLGLSATALSQDVIENNLGMRFIQVPAGEFLMGTAEIEEARMEFPEPADDEVIDETPQHRIIFSKPFYIGETEVTQAIWLEVMENRPGPDEFWQRDDWQKLPVAAASWFMAQRFVEELNKLDPQFHYRLPTEAEWEYAARAGSTGLRPVSLETLENSAWFINNSADKPQPVATRAANAFGLYDTLGNVWEWVSDWYAPDTYTRDVRSDPRGPENGISKVRRGGSYHCPVHLLRPAYRAASKPSVSYSVQGFRLVLEPRKTNRETGHE